MSAQRTSNSRILVAGLTALALSVHLVLVVGIMDPSVMQAVPAERHVTEHAASSGHTDGTSHDPALSGAKHGGPHCLVCQTQAIGLALLTPSLLVLAPRIGPQASSRPGARVFSPTARSYGGTWVRAPPARPAIPSRRSGLPA
ncbi:MAG TPA: DUF2946 family protein [Alphaproteobacteria bacterium]|nr:DUF2946 family protein [Alphaproteobacteria bacterium]